MIDTNLLEAALAEARRRGADYAEARAEDHTAAGVRVRNGAVQRLTSRGDSGWGLHVVEELSTARLFAGEAAHPYTRILLATVPTVRLEQKREELSFASNAPDFAKPASGCSFHPRCFAREDICTHESPVLKDIGGGHQVACHR